MSEPTPTQVLLERAKKGDREALNDLYKLHEPNLLAIVRKKLGRGALRNRLESFDIVQDVYASFCQPKNIDKFEYSSDEEFLGFMARMIAHDIRDWIDYWDRKRRNPGYQVAQLLSSIPERHVPTPSVVLQMQEAEELLRRALERLPSEAREIIIAHKERGQSYDEIAKEQGTSSGAVRMKLKRAECRLKTIYQELESEGPGNGTTRR